MSGNVDSESYRDESKHFNVDGLVGRTIVAAAELDHGGDWDEHTSYILELDNGVRVEFSGWGYDAWGAELHILNPRVLSDRWKRES